MATSFSISKISDDLARKRLTDVDEADESRSPHLAGDKWTYERKMSSGSVLSDSSRMSSPDDLKKYRSSEASISADSFNDYWKLDDIDGHRSPDANIVLTENTDQFIIGDRVWVGGIKPGQIAYIGETQFAPGEWAGIVLDDPIGKNDGTVANIRYFQCEPKKGIFSRYGTLIAAVEATGDDKRSKDLVSSFRLTRLTKRPLCEGGAGEPAATKSVPVDPKKSNGTTYTSVPKKSLVLTPTSSVKNSVSKPLSSESGAPTNLALGDRVIIKSSQGSKAGILRYMGTTDFAAGEWCGVELDDPLGKNDGSVSGTRYFECRPKFGLFAPLHKVSKSPANKRFFQPCMVHPGRTASSLRRQGSKESLVSMSSTASTTASVRSTARKIAVKTPTTTTLQDTLKKKEFQIEQLLKQRDLERAEVTRAAGQADEAERQLACLKKEFEKHRAESEARVSDLDALVCLLKSEKKAIVSQLDDERKKFDDLQFRFEEETIDKADIRSTVAQYEEKLNMLQKTLSDERKRAEMLEHDSNKLFEAEEQMVIIKDELDTTKEELQAQKTIRSSLEQEQISLEAHLTSARAEIESLKIENQSLKATVAADESNLKEELAGRVQKLEETKKELETAKRQVEQLSRDVETKDQILNEKEKELHAQYLTKMQELAEKHKAEMNNLNESMNNNWQSKLKVLEIQLEEEINVNKALKEKLNQVNILLTKTNTEKELEESKQKENAGKLEEELRQLSTELQKKDLILREETVKLETAVREKETLQEELTQMKNLLSAASDSRDKQVTAMNEIIDKQKEELGNLKSQIDVKTKECDLLKNSEVHTREEYELKLQQINNILKEKNSELEKANSSTEKIKEEFTSKAKETNELLLIQEEFKTKIKHLEDTEMEKKTELERLSRELETSRNSLEARENELKNEQTNSKNLAEKLFALEENYRKVSEEKDQMELQTGDTLRKLQSAEEKLNQLNAQKVKLETDISSFINSSNDSSAQLIRLNEDLRAKEKEMDSLREEISTKSRHFEHVEQELKQMVERQEATLRATKEEREKEKHFFSEEMEKLKGKVEASATALQQTESEWKKKAENSANEAENQIKNLQEKIRSSEKLNLEDRNKHDNEVKELTNLQNQLQKKLEIAQAEATEMRTTLEKKIQELNLERVNLLETVEKTTAEFLTNEKKLGEKAKRDAELLESESEKLRNELKETSEKLKTTMEELGKEKEEKNKLNEEKVKLEKANADMCELLRQSEEKNAELVKNVSSTDSENKVLKESINQLREEKCHLEEDAMEKMTKMTELNSQLQSMENSKKSGDAQMELKTKTLEEEITRLQQSLQKTEADRVAENSDKTKRIEDLEKIIQTFKDESSQMISGKQKDIETANAAVIQMKAELDEKKRDGEKKQQEIDSLMKDQQSLKQDVESEKKKCQDYERRCEALETEKMNLMEKYKEQTKLLAHSSELANKLAEVRKKLAEVEKREQDAANSSKSARETLENMLERTNDLLNQREKEMKALTKEVETMRQEKLELEKQKQTIEKVQIKAQAENSNDQLEERDFEKGQVDFLNSVIVDMQKKNDALKARIEILEMGYSPEDVEEFNLHNINARSVAPRLFCDICDRFDLHDTEDCPTQASQEEQPPPKSSKTKVPPPERPYCEICEVFGHDTADCDDGETF
ncbi:hypothetical protein RUM43_005350 [Polyplax serrata]|uniref:CAP-Gly domain-containing protein n=1 Tax=Polyplax serrata TaxID=468196 RepID=A0AAN8S8L8_POLSC